MKFIKILFWITLVLLILFYTLLLQEMGSLFFFLTCLKEAPLIILFLFVLILVYSLKREFFPKTLYLGGLLVFSALIIITGALSGHLQYYLAIYTHNVTFCKNLQSQECLMKAINNKTTPEQCATLGVEFEASAVDCDHRLAIVTNNIKFCDSILALPDFGGTRQSGFKNCMKSLALKNLRSELCQELADPYQSSCYNDLSILAKNKDLCAMTQPGGSPSCWDFFASELKDESLCSQIKLWDGRPNVSKVVECLVNVAGIKKDKKICEEVEKLIQTERPNDSLYNLKDAMNWCLRMINDGSTLPYKNQEIIREIRKSNMLE